MIQKIYFSSLLLFLCVQPLLAQEKDTTLNRRMDEVVVTGTRASVHRNNVPLTLSVVTRREIEESGESALLNVLSERVPGLFVTQRGVTGFGIAEGGTGSMSLRGIGGSPTTRILILIDGHPQYMGIMGHHLPDAYVSSDVERAEVIRGPGSLLYGSNAMGGVVNIITRKQEHQGWSANARLMYGSYNTQKYMANAGVNSKKFEAFLSVNHDHTDGHRPSSAFSITNGYLKLGYRLSPHFKLWGDASLAAYETENPGTVMQPMIDNTADILRGVASLTLENEYAKSNGALKFFYNFGKHKINDGYAEGGTPRNYLFHSQDHNYGLTCYQSFRPFAGQLVTAGIDYKNFGGKAWNAYVNNVTPDKELLPEMSRYEAAGYITIQQTLFERLTLNAGVRLEHSEQFGTEWIPQGGVAWRPWPQTVFKASVSKGFRSPTIKEMYMFPPQNPDLQPESMMSYELSAWQSLFNGQLSLELTGYIAKGDNLIMTQMLNGSPKNLNTGDFNHKGIEFSANWEIFNNLRINGNYTYLHMEKPVLNAPGQQAFLSAAYRPGKWTLSAGFQYIHDLYTVLESKTAAAIKEQYGVLNAQVGYRPLQWIEVFVKGDNLTATSYETIYGYPMPGVTLFGGLNIIL